MIEPTAIQQFRQTNRPVLRFQNGAAYDKMKMTGMDVQSGRSTGRYGMKTMKRTAALLLCALLLLGLCACTGKSASSEPVSGGHEEVHEEPEEKTERPAQDASDDKLSWKDVAKVFGKDGASGDPEDAAPEDASDSAPEAPPPEDSVSETMRLMAGDYALRTYDDYAGEGTYYDYEDFENQRIVNGSPSGSLTLNADGTGRLRCLDREADIRWDEESFFMDGDECWTMFSAQTLYIDTPDNARIVYSKVSHLDEWNATLEQYANREVADAGDYALGEPEIVRYDVGRRSYIYVRVPIENKSDHNLGLDTLYFTTCRPDGTEIAFFSLPPTCMRMLLPGEKGEFFYPYFVSEDSPGIRGYTSAAAFPENVVIRVDEVDVFRWSGTYQRLEAEITEIVSFVDTITGTYTVVRPNGYVTLPEGTDIEDVYLYVYCYDKAGNMIGFGAQFACESSINPVNYFEEVPGEHRGKFQTNMNGPFENLNYPPEQIDHYVVVANAPSYFY
jgi:hypothetical protein